MLRRFYDRLVTTLVVVAVTVMLGAALVGTVSRYLTFLPSISWGEEVTRFAGIWSVFLVAGLTIRQGAHLGVDFLTARLPLRVRAAARLVNCALILAFSGLLLLVRPPAGGGEHAAVLRRRSSGRWGWSTSASRSARPS